MIAYVKGYDVCSVTNKIIKKELFLSELKLVDSDIENELESAIQEHSYVIGLKKKKILKAVYIFKKNNIEQSLIFSQAIMTDDIKKETIKEFEDSIVEELKEKVSIDEVKKVDWNDIEIIPNKKLALLGTSFYTCLGLGFLYGVIFDNVSMGLIFGAVIGILYGAVVRKK